MASDLDIRKFLRRAPHLWLERYFRRRGLLVDFHWQAPVRKAKIEALLKALGSLRADERHLTFQDFEAVERLATPAGKLQFIDEAAYRRSQDEIAAALAEFDDFYSIAFWVLMERRELWDGALRYAMADAASKRFWRKRINMPQLGRKPTKEDAVKLGRALSDLYMAKEARGHRYVVNLYRRGADGRREYFFAYLEDHRHTPLVFDEDAELVAEPHSPAFDIIFILDDSARTLSVWHDGSLDRTKDLQQLFAQAVLGSSIPRAIPKDDTAYNLQCFLDPTFTFNPSPALRIERVDVRRLRVRVWGASGRTVQVQLDEDTPSHVLGETINAALRGVAVSDRKVTQVGLRVTFHPMPKVPKQKTRSFLITAPNSCNLQVDQFSPLIERLLADHGIEPHLQPRDGNGLLSQSGPRGS